MEEEDLREAQKEVTKDYEDMTDSEVHRQSTVGISKIKNSFHDYRLK